MAAYRQYTDTLGVPPGAVWMGFRAIENVLSTITPRTYTTNRIQALTVEPEPITYQFGAVSVPVKVDLDLDPDGVWMGPSVIEAGRAPATR